MERNFSVIIEGIQGVGGINVADESFLKKIRNLCDEYSAVYIADSVQCGYGRSGKFFSHDYAGVNADIYTMAKGMGNGFPVGGIIIAPHINQNILCWALHLAAIIWPVLLHWLYWK